jgi:hypothetical protein
MPGGRPGVETEDVTSASALHWRPATLLAAAATVAALACALLAANAAGSVRSSATDHAHPELLKTVPIGKSPWSDARSVLSISPQRLGALAAGDRIQATGEQELTICLKPNPRHPGDGQPCVGDMYGFNPTLKAKLVLAPSASSSNGSNTVTISKTVSLTCHQNHPVRNHHCVVAVPWSSFKVTDPGKLPCPADACYLNMVVSAHHSQAGSNNKVVVGSSDDNGNIHQSLGKLSAVRLRPADSRPKTTWRGGRATKKLPVARKGGDLKKKVIYSAKIKKLKAGDQLVVDAKARTAIGHLPYNVFQRTELVLAKSRKSIKPFGKVAESTSRVSASNGINCTQKKSGHSNVCTIRKGGILSVKKGAKGPFFVNVVAGQSAVGTAPMYNRWRSGHVAKVPRRGGFVKVKRYRGSGSCRTCATGWTSFRAADPPSGKVSALVRQLAGFKIFSGQYNCKWRRDPVAYVCHWTASGRVGDSPRYECSSKAWYRKKAKNFKINVCKDQLGAQLWNRLVNAKVPVAPSYAGACKDKGGGIYRCKWYGEGVTGALEGRFCSGYGRYDTDRHSWRIDTCTNPNA